MRRLQSFLTLSVLVLTPALVACDGGDDDSGDELTTDEASDTQTGDGDGDTMDTGDGDGDTGSCYPQPPECAQMMECFAEILPDVDVSKYGADGSCWCGTEDEALECYNTCKEQLDLAIEQNPTVGVCHGRYCPLEDLDPNEPYGPADNGCPEGSMALDLPVAGTYCAPECTGLAEFCPEHSQTIADGTCFWGGADVNYCALYCYVDPYVFASGTQCQCGATCQPYGGADADGNLRGVCTFE